MEARFFFPHGVYNVKDLSIAENKICSLVGRGATLRAIPGASCILNVGANIKRHVPLHVKGLRFDGSKAKKHVIGLRINGKVSAKTYSKIRTNLHISDCSFWNCKVGIDLHATLNCHVQDTVCSLNQLGIVLRQTKNSGCGNANLFSNVELYNNQIGMILSGRGSKFAMANNVFTGGTIQNNPCLWIIDV